MMSVDVEEWFHTRNFWHHIPRKDWDNLESRVVQSTNLILDILAENNDKSTFFILGWVAKRHPQIVKRIHQEGHEVASHGNGHDCVYDLTQDEFREDIRISTDILENITGEKVIGYRAPNFSITDWAIDILQEYGFEYDSSWFPTFTHDRYGKLVKYKTKDEPIYELKKGFYEVPMSCLKFMGKNLPWAGGGYFRLYPYPLFKGGIKRILKEQNVYNFYIHPWEFDPEQPKIKSLDKKNYFRQYNNLQNTEKNYRDMVEGFSFQTIRDFLIQTKQTNINE